MIKSFPDTFTTITHQMKITFTRSVCNYIIEKFKYIGVKFNGFKRVIFIMKGILNPFKRMSMNYSVNAEFYNNILQFSTYYIPKFNFLLNFKGAKKRKICILIPSNTKNYANVIKYFLILKLYITKSPIFIEYFSRDKVNYFRIKFLIKTDKAKKRIFLCEYLKNKNLGIGMKSIFYKKTQGYEKNKIDNQELSVLFLHLFKLWIVYINKVIIFKKFYLKCIGKVNLNPMVILN